MCLRNYILVILALPVLSSCSSNGLLCQTGTFVRYEGDGSIIESCIVERKRGHKIQEGPMHVYDSTSGKMINRMFFVDGKLHGAFQHWDTTGKLKAQGLYYEGKKHGIWSYWGGDGNLAKKEKYNNGILVDTQIK